MGFTAFHLDEKSRKALPEIVTQMDDCFCDLFHGKVFVRKDAFYASGVITGQMTKVISHNFFVLSSRVAIPSP